MATGSGYGRLVQLTGWPFLLVGLLARLPLAMGQIGILLLVSQAIGSYAAGGFAAGAFAIANSIGAPLAGNLTDRVGQRWVVTAQSLVGGLGMISLVVAADQQAPFAVLLVCAIVTGAFMPQIGTMARVRWRALDARHPAERGRILTTSFSWEGAADEASFVLGPASVGALALLGGPAVGLVVGGVVVAVFGTWFAHHPTVTLAHPVSGDHSSDPRSVWSAAMLLLSASMLMIGTFFGSIQTGSAVLATTAGRPGLTGLLHALLGVGSVLAGLMLPMVPPRIGLVRRWRIFTGGLVMCALPLLLVEHLGLLVVILLVSGVFVAPSMITVFSLAERVTPPRRLGTAMTIIAATTTLGYALGASLAGPLADWGGQRPAYGVTVTAAVAMTLIAWVAGRLVHRAAARDETATAPTD